MFYSTKDIFLSFMQKPFQSLKKKGDWNFRFPHICLPNERFAVLLL